MNGIKKKKRILFATDSYHNLPTANGICVEALANELNNKGIETHILCFRHGNEKKEDIINGINIHRIKMDWVNQLRYKFESRKQDTLQVVYKKLMILLNRMEAMIFLQWFPMRSLIFCRRYLKEMKLLQSIYDFDMILASYCPFEAAYALGKIKKYADVKTSVYCLDSFTNLKKRFFMSPEFQDKRAWKWEKDIFNSCDMIFNLKCHEKHYSQSRYDCFKEKMFIVDIPHMIEHKVLENKSTKKHKESIRIVYAGSLRYDLLEHVVRLLSPLFKESAIVWDIYGRNTGEFFNKLCDAEVRQQIKLKGFIPREQMIIEEQSSDILLSMGNANTDFIPSKIFEYISIGKKILHFYNYDRDSAVPYYSLYPNSCCINVKDDYTNNIKKIRNFISSPCVELSFEDIKKLYEKNTPKYTVDLITDFVNNRKE
jgi:hypothetical protein